MTQEQFEALKPGDVIRSTVQVGRHFRLVKLLKSGWRLETLDCEQLRQRASTASAWELVVL